MDDTLTISAAITGLGAAAIILSEGLNEIYEATERASMDVIDLATDLAGFALILDELGRLFKNSPSICSTSLQESLWEVVRTCRAHLRGFKTLVNKAQTCSDKSKSIDHSARWIFRRSQLLRTLAVLNSFKVTMSLVLQTLKLAVKKIEADDEIRLVLLCPLISVFLNSVC